MAATTSPERPMRQVLAEYLTRTTLEDIPSEVQRKAALCILDTVGCMVAGSAAPVGRIVTQYAVDHGEPGPCTLYGRPETVSLERAALANGTLGHVLELDDGHRPSDNHLGCVVVPAAIAAAEQVGATGADILLAVVLGYDVMGRVGQAVCLPRLQTPFHHTGTTGGFGAAAAAGVLMGLSEEEVANALGIAGTGAAGLREVFVSGTDCKSFQVGRGTHNGINAVLMASAGLEGPERIIEGEHGFTEAMTPIPRPELVVEDLGTRFAVMDSAFKVHAVCGMLFTPIDASIALRAEHGLAPEEIERIEVALPGWVREDSVFTRKRPPSIGTARFSVPFGVAAALKDGEVSPRQVSEAGIADPVIASLEEKVVITADEEVDALFERTKEDDFFFYPSKVTVHTKDGSHRRFEKTPRGYDLNRALTEQEVIDKFRSNTADILGAEEADRAAEVLLGLDGLESTKELAVLRPERPGSPSPVTR